MKCAFPSEKMFDGCSWCLLKPHISLGLLLEGFNLKKGYNLSICTYQMPLSNVTRAHCVTISCTQTSPPTPPNTFHYTSSKHPTTLLPHLTPSDLSSSPLLLTITNSSGSGSTFISSIRRHNVSTPILLERHHLEFFQSQACSAYLSWYLIRVWNTSL